MPDFNDVVGGLLLVIGAAAVVLSLVAFVKVQFSRGPKRGTAEVLKYVDAILKDWLEILKVIPEGFRHIFVLLPFGLVLMLLGLWVLVQRPI